ncbi:hypothetical protein C8R47DRAFT_155483 [Mycena vitilis]|nr:hypothetical protein C8R47DRAFT_155483 [Mycena vitilis]
MRSELPQDALQPAAQEERMGRWGDGEMGRGSISMEGNDWEGPRARVRVRVGRGSGGRGRAEAVGRGVRMVAVPRVLLPRVEPRAPAARDGNGDRGGARGRPPSASPSSIPTSTTTAPIPISIGIPSTVDVDRHAPVSVRRRPTPPLAMQPRPPALHNAAAHVHAAPTPPRGRRRGRERVEPGEVDGLAVRAQRRGVRGRGVRGRGGERGAGGGGRGVAVLPISDSSSSNPSS